MGQTALSFANKDRPTRHIDASLDVRLPEFQAEALHRSLIKVLIIEVVLNAEISEIGVFLPVRWSW